MQIGRLPKRDQATQSAVCTAPLVWVDFLAHIIDVLRALLKWLLLKILGLDFIISEAGQPWRMSSKKMRKMMTGKR